MTAIINVGLMIDIYLLFHQRRPVRDVIINVEKLPSVGLAIPQDQFQILTCALIRVLKRVNAILLRNPSQEQKSADSTLSD